MNREERRARKKIAEDKKIKCGVHIRNVSKSLRDQFKAACDVRGTTMRKEIVIFMKSYVKQRLRF